MNTLRYQQSRWAQLAFATTLTVVGCVAPHAAHEDTQEIGVVESAVVKKGQICAADTLAKATCVPSGGSVDAAYKGAVATCKGVSTCSGVYDIWPVLPKGMTADQAIRNKDVLKQFLADIDLIAAYARTSLSAEAYEHILEVSLAVNVSQLSAWQRDAIDRPDPTAMAPLAEFERRLREEASAETDPLALELASKKQTAAKVQAIMASVQTQLAAQRKAYTSIVERFKTLKASEAGYLSALTAFSSRASKAALVDLPAVQMDLLKYTKTSNEQTDQLALDATRLRASMAQLETLFQLKLEPYADFIDESMGATPELTVSAQRSLSSMVAYCEQRRSQSDTQVAALFRGISARSSALIAAAASAKTRDAFRKAAHLKASAAFLDEATARNNEISKVPAKTAKYGFYLWAEKYDQYLAVLELEPLCGTGPDAARPSWRDTGCVSFARTFGRAHTYTEKTIPQSIRLAIAQLRAKGVAEDLLTQIDTQLKAGSIRQAAISYDAAARLTEDM